MYGIKEGIDALGSDQDSNNINDAPADALNDTYDGDDGVISF